MILVTGGAGFIGSHIVYELNKRGFEDIVILDSFGTTEKWKNLRGLKFKRFYLLKDYLEDRTIIPFSQISNIFHMGACSATTVKDMDFLLKNNVEFSQELFRIATNQKIPFIYASSAATYGAGELGYDDEPELIPRLIPLNAYGYSKQLFDEWVLNRTAFPPRWNGLKFFNVFGPNEYHKGDMSSVVFKSFNQIKQKGKVRLFKSHRDDYEHGEQQRDFIYAKDVAKVLVELMHKEDSITNGIFNLGSGQARSFLDLVKAVGSACSKAVNIEFFDIPENIRNQYQYYTQAEMNSLLRLLPNIKLSSLEEGIGDYVQNYLLKSNSYLALHSRKRR